MLAARSKLTIVGLCSAIFIAASQAESILSHAEKLLGQSPYFVFVINAKYEIAACLTIAVLIYSVDYRRLGLWYETVRENWKGRKVAVFGLALHVEELVLGFAAAVTLGALALFATSTVLTTYKNYGLAYVARQSCEGNMDAAVERLKLIEKNQLWKKYTAYLHGATERYQLLGSLTGKRLNQFQSEQGRRSAEETLAQLVELRLIFGRDPAQTIPAVPASGNPALLREWQAYLAKSHC